MPPANPADPPPPATPATPARGSEDIPLPPDFPPPPRPWPGLDRLAVLQTTGGLVLALIALFSSYDHLTLAGHRIAIHQQWGIPCILASVAVIFVDAELAPVREIEQRAKLIEQRTRLIEKDIEQIERETKLIERETEQIEK